MSGRLPSGAIPLVLALAAIPAAALAGTVDRIAAVVGGEIILLSEVEQRAAPALAEIEKAAQQGAGLMAESRRDGAIRQTLEQLIDERLVAQQAREMQIKVTVDEVDRAVDNMARENGIDRETLMRAIEAQGMDPATYRNNLRSQLLRFKVLNLRIRGRVKVGEPEARQYYNDQVRDVRATGTFTGAHILVRVPPNAHAAEVAASRARIEEIYDRLRAGEQFSQLAAELSDDEATASHGGSLGERRPGEIPQVLRRAFLDLEEGEVGGPLRTSAGFHLVTLLAREALGVQSFAEVRDRIIGQLTQREMARQEKIWLKELRLRTFIDVRL